MITNAIYRIPMALLIISLAACSGNGNQQSQGEEISSYETLTLEPQTVTLYNEYPATLQGTQVVEIRPKVDGYLEKIWVTEGQRVSKGQLLFTIFNPSYTQTIQSTKASIRSAQADVRSAEIDYNNKKGLVAEKVVGTFQLDESKNTLESKKAALAQLEAELASAQTNEAYTRLYAPADGVVSTIPYKVGALVSSSNSSALTTLSNASDINAYFSLDEKSLLSEGEKLNATARLILANDSLYEYTGKMAAATDIVNTATGSLQYKATFPNPKGLLKSGNFATVRIPYTVNDAIVIPQTATYEMQDKRFAYVVRTDNRIENVFITTTSTNNGQYFIVNSGLKAGDKVVLTGVGTSLKDSMQIKPKMVKSDSVYSLLNKK